MLVGAEDKSQRVILGHMMRDDYAHGGLARSILLEDPFYFMLEKSLLKQPGLCGQ